MFDPDQPRRPEHPDFWRMSEVILQLDRRMEAAQDDEDRERIFMTVVHEHCDVDSLLYMASHRAYRVVGVKTHLDIIEHLHELAWLTTVFVEAFIAGMDYQCRLTGT